MRKYSQIFPDLSLTNKDYQICPSQNKTIDGTCRYTSYQILSEPIDYLFTNTEFSGCSHSENGGALSCSKAGASLTIEGCSFTSCNCGSKDGGAIFVDHISLLCIQNTVFGSCGGNYDATTAGAVCIQYVPSVLIRNNLFLRCYSNDNGGAIYMRNSGTQPSEHPIQYSSFIHCECDKGGSPSGGALEGFSNYCSYFSSVLFSFCKSTHGGAVWIEPEHFVNSISFSFFSHNIGGVDRGSDVAVYIYPDDLEGSIFLHTFTTSELNRISNYNSQWQPVTTDQDWLPQGYEEYARKRRGSTT